MKSLIQVILLIEKHKQAYDERLPSTIEVVNQLGVIICNKNRVGVSYF